MMFSRLFRRNPDTASTNAFAVDSVEVEKRHVWTQSLAESLRIRFMRDIIALPASDKTVVNHLIDSFTPDLRRRLRKSVVSRAHPLVDAVHLAFSTHFPLVLSPDAIWLVLAQGFSHHVQENAETLRGRFVKHEGKTKLVETVTNLKLESFQQAIAGFSLQIRDLSDPVLYNTLVCDFSTTTPDIRTASEVVLMDTYSNYFEYELRCVCGIPWIALTGTPDDWERIRARFEVFETFGLAWWTSRVRPILDEFVNTANGNPNREFWQAIYKPKPTYGDTCVTGWLADLFPYLGERPRSRNRVLDAPRENWLIPLESGVETTPPIFQSPGVRASSFPTGLSSVPVRVTLPTGDVRDLDLVAGFLAIEQNPKDYSLSPVIGWAVADPPPDKPIVI